MSECVLICLQCKGAFVVSHKQAKVRKFCSVNCANQNKTKKIVIDCLECKEPFAVYPSQQSRKYCSQVCNGKSRRGPKTSVETSCMTCGITFFMKLSRFKLYQNHFCSKACRIRREKLLHRNVMVTCPLCRKVRYLTPRDYDKAKTDICRTCFYKNINLVKSMIKTAELSELSVV